MGKQCGVGARVEIGRSGRRPGARSHLRVTWSLQTPSPAGPGKTLSTHWSLPHSRDGNLSQGLTGRVRGKQWRFQKVMWEKLLCSRVTKAQPSQDTEHQHWKPVTNWNSLTHRGISTLCEAWPWWSHLLHSTGKELIHS